MDLRQGALAGICLLGCGVVWAQESVPEPAAADTIPVEAVKPEAEPALAAPAAAAPAQDNKIDEIVVTARRKEERAVDVPISLAVLDGETLGEANMTLATDIQERVPGLVVSVPNARLTSYTIRGLGSTSANDGIESSVGLFLDGVYLGRQGLSIFDLIDLERVEVLRGPQGTLFGKNTTAGAINIVTEAPKPDFLSKVEAVVGDLGSRQLRASVNSLITETLAGRITGYLVQRDGTLDNVYDGSKLNNREKRGLRGQLLWTPVDDLSGRFIAEIGTYHEACCAYPLTGPMRDDVIQRDAYMDYTRTGLDPAEHKTDSDAPTRSDMRQRALSGEFNWELGDSHTLTSISAWREWNFLPLNDDGSSLHLASTSTRNDHRQFSQELRLTSSFDSVDTMLGLFYLHQNLHGFEQIILGDDMVGWVFGGQIRQRALPFATEANTGPVLYAVIPPETLAGMTVDTSYFQKSESMAGFASMDWHLSEKIDWSFGVRYTYERKEASVRRTRYGGDPDATVLSTGDPILGVAEPFLEFLDPIVSVIEEVIDLQLPTTGWNGILDDVAGGEFARDTTYSEGDYSGQTSISYELDPDFVGYVSAALGYKGGGINLGFTGPDIEPTFRPERATSFEAGLKTRLFDRAWSLNFAVYHTEVKDYQALTFDNQNTLLPNPRQINLLNVGKVRLRGVEIEGYGYAAEGLMLRGGVAFSDAITSEFPNAPNENTRANDQNLSGKPLYNAPRWSGTAGAEYQTLWGSSLEPYLGLDYSYRSGYYGTVEHGRASYIDGYSIANARLGLRANDRSWDVQAWVRNAFDTQYVATVAPLYGVGDYGAVPADGRTIGVNLRLQFY